MPPHERPWRHPSELGAAQWALTEPPLSMGRGLVVITAAVGGMLTLTLLWAMLPPASKPGPLAVASTAISQPTERIRRSSTSFAASSTAVAAGPVATAGAVSTLERPSSTTLRTTAPRPIATVQAPDVELSTAPPMAVALAGTDLAVTTARAAGSATTLTVTLVEGKVVQAEVIAVDTGSGLAVLGLPDDVATKALQVASGRDGQPVMVGGQEPHPAVLTTDAASGALTVVGDDTIGTPEGTPVTDSAGNLVGLCSWRDGVAQLITIGDVTALDDMLPEAPGWMGVQLTGDRADPLTIAAVDATGPAAAAGVQPGDGIVALDGVVVTSVAQLTGLLAERRPGDPVVLQVRRAGGDIALTITLAAQPDL